MKREVFERINVRVPKERIWARLGYARGKTKLSSSDFTRCEAYLDSALAKIELKGAAAILAIEEKEKENIFLKEGITLRSLSLGNFLKNCREVLFLGATAGSGIIDLISGKNSQGSLDESVVADAAASEMVDAALGWIIDYQARQLRRQNKILTANRFSAGYGDFGLENQKIIYQILKLKEIGVKLRKTSVLEPEKSVTAVCGVK